MPDGDPEQAFLVFALAGEVTQEQAQDPFRSAELDLTLAYLEETIQLSPDVVAAFGSGSNAVHASGLASFDAMQIERTNHVKLATVRMFLGGYGVMQSGARAARLQPKGLSRAERRAAPRVGVDWQSPDTIRWVRGLQRDQELENLPTVDTFRTLHDFIYQPELELPPSSVVPLRDEEQIRLVFTADEITQGVTSLELSQRLRSVGIIDASQPMLSARVENLFDILQFDIGLHFLRTLQDMCTCRGKTEQAATALFKAHRAQLLTSDLPAKISMIIDTDKMLKRLSQEKAGTLEAEALTVMSIRAANLLEHITLLKETYRTVYAKLKFGVDELPAVLRPAPATVEKTREARPEAVTVAAGSLALEVVPSVPDPALVESLKLRVARLADKAQEANKLWAMNKGARDKTKLAVKALMAVDGCKNGDEELLGRMDRPDAEALVAVLYHLDRLGARPNRMRAQAELFESLKKQAQVRSQVEIRRAEAAADRVTDIAYPGVVPASYYIRLFRSEWPLYMKVIAQIWPGDALQKEVVATHIHNILFLSTAT
jgi:hypothetical protein